MVFLLFCFLKNVDTGVGEERQTGTASFDLEDATQVSGSDASKNVGQDARQDARQDAIRKVGRAVSSEKGSQKEGPESGG